MGGLVKSTLIWSALLTVEGGYASGDSDRYDGTQRTYQFDPNYRVGLILFPMMNGVYTRTAVDNARDPNYVHVCPRRRADPEFGGVENQFTCIRV